MKNQLSNLLMVLGFCVGTVGATGFHSPADSANGAPGAGGGDAAIAEEASSTETYAWAFLLGGLAVLGVGAAMSRSAKAAAAGDSKSGAVGAIQQELAGIQALVAGLDDAKGSLGDADLMSRIDDMRTGALFDIGSRSDSFAAQIGFDDYARIWGDFATCERLLNRSWSMAADGYGDESRAEIPLARAAINSAVNTCASLAS